MPEHKRVKILSGGQSGVDRAALDAAIARGVAYGGWCPKGGWAEDFPDPPGVLALYPKLRETPEVSPNQRTAWNIRDADALLVLVDGAGLAISKGTGFAIDCAEALAKPHALIDSDADEAGALAAGFIGAWPGPLALCIGGPRESEAPGIYAKARGFLATMLAGL